MRAIQKDREIIKKEHMCQVDVIFHWSTNYIHPSISLPNQSTETFHNQEKEK